jgi:hypothetical protein
MGGDGGGGCGAQLAAGAAGHHEEMSRCGLARSVSVCVCVCVAVRLGLLSCLSACVRCSCCRLPFLPCSVGLWWLLYIVGSLDRHER